MNNIYDEMTELLAAIGKEFGTKYMFNPEAFYDNSVIALRHPLKENFIHIEKMEDTFEITIFLNRNKFMLVTTANSCDSCIVTIKKYEYLMDADVMEFSDINGNPIECICVDAPRGCNCQWKDFM